jgi:hypothetical protein
MAGVSCCCRFSVRMSFDVSFDLLAEPLVFRTVDGERTVRGFGIKRLDDSDARGEQLQAQVEILDYHSDDNFVLRLAPVASKDEIVLAKIAPGKTLDETIDAVFEQVSHPDALHTGRRIVNEETLAVPRLTIGVDRKYSEIINREIVGTLLHVSEARQTIQFALDETGAVLESEAIIIGEDGIVPPRRSPVGSRKFVFNRPFLVYLIEHGADRPYFAAWIENTEFMETIGR